MHPTSLLPDGGPDLSRRLPEAEGAVTGGKLGVDDEAVLVAQPDQQLVPALLALPEAVVERQELLLAARVSADQNQDALAVVLEPGREADPVRPDVDVAFRRQIAGRPALMLVLPGGHQAADRRRRKAGGSGPSKTVSVSSNWPVEMPSRSSQGSSSPMFLVRRR